jgi:hypothetical protein
MALKCYKEFKGWDALETFYGEKVNGVYTLVENFERSYCHDCGKVTATLNNACTCGTSKFRKLPDLDWYVKRDGIIDSRVSTEYNATTDTYTILAEVLKLNVSNRDDLEVFRETTKIIEFGKNKYFIYDKDLLRRVNADSLNDYKYKDDLLAVSCFFNYHYETSTVLDVNTATKIIDAINTAPLLFEDPDSMRFKYLTNHFIQNIEGGLKPSMNNTLRKNLESRKTHHKYFEILDKFCKNNTGYYWGREYEVVDGCKRSYYSAPKGTYSEFLNECEKKYSKAKGHAWGVLYHHLMSGAITLDDFCTILKQYNFLFDYKKGDAKGTNIDFFGWGHVLKNGNTFDNFWEKAYLSLFPIYVRENIYGKPTRDLVISFCTDLYLMTENAIPIDEDSIKLKNYNYNLNERNLSSHLGIAPEKIEVFLDTFDRNPLASISLLKDRRKLTKKQMDEYMEMLDKE